MKRGRIPTHTIFALTLRRVAMFSVTLLSFCPWNIRRQKLFRIWKDCQYFYNIYLYIKHLPIYEIIRYEIFRKIFTKIFVNNKSTSFKISRATASNFSVVSWCLLFERNIQHPMQVVLNSPVSSCQHIVVRSFGIVLVAYVIPFPYSRAVSVVHCGCYFDNGLQPVPSGSDFPHTRQRLRAESCIPASRCAHDRIPSGMRSLTICWR